MNLYSRLCTRSRRALVKVKKRWGYPYEYKPRGNLLERLAKETGMTIDQVYVELMKIRIERLQTMGYHLENGRWVL